MKQRLDIKKNLAKAIIAELLGDLSDFFLSLPPLPHTSAARSYYYHAMPEAQWQKMVEDEKKKRVIRDLKRKKELSVRKDGDRFLVAISTHLTVEALKTLMRQETKLLSKGDICLVVFDFPNGATKARNQWRRMLLSCGFNMLQLSVYTIRKDVICELSTLIDLLHAKKWIRVFRASGQY